MKIPCIVKIGLLFVLGSCGAWTLFAFTTLNNEKPGYGIFGDSFGALNTLFTGLACVGVVYTIWQQHEDTKSRDKEMAQERFQSIFYTLLEREANFAQSISIQSKKATNENGLMAFKTIADEIITGTTGHSDDFEKILESYKGFEETYRSALRTHRQHLFLLFTFLDSRKIDEGDKLVYASIIRSGLSIDQLFLLGLHVASGKQDEFNLPPKWTEYLLDVMSSEPRHFRNVIFAKLKGI